MRRSFLAFSLLLATPVLHAQEAAQPIYLDGADSLRSAVVEGVLMRTFLGHVRFHQGTLSIACDRAVQNLVTNNAELTGNVVLIQDTLTIRAPHAFYDASAQLARADGGVRLTDRVVTLTAPRGTYDVRRHVAAFTDGVTIANDTATITARTLTYDRETLVADAAGAVRVVDTNTVITCDTLRNDRRAQTSACHGRVRVRERRERTVIFADTLFHDHRANHSTLPRNPLLVHVDSARAGDTAAAHWRYDTTFIRARAMEAFRGDSETYVATDSVRLVRGALDARCERAIFRRVAGVITLTRDPVVWYGGTELAAESIAVTLQHDSLQRIDADGAAFAHSPADSAHADRRNQLAGAHLALFFTHDSLARVRVEKNALSMYFGYEDDRPRGVNRASGDTIVIDMHNGAPETVRTLGGGEGEYWPENRVRSRVRDYRLPGFEDHAALRPRRADMILPPTP